MQTIIGIILVLICAIGGGFRAIPDVQAAEEKSINCYVINGSEKIVNDYTALEENFTLDIEDKYKIYNPDELTEEILINRTKNDTLIIERIIGVVTNKNRKGDGKILNTTDEYYNYINYSNADLPITDGTILLTYCIYNPDSDYTDDIVDRFDFILDRNFED